MQLNKQLALAAGTLLSTVSGVTHSADWLIDSSVLLYSERDSQGQDRVNTVKPVLSITKQNTPDDYVNVKLVYDALTGASPNGGFASSKTQVFTAPSGGSSYSVAPGYTPLDPSFKDTRIALSVNWMTPINRMTRYSAGFNFSTESDYTSASGSYSLLKDFNNKQTTLTVGMAYSYDTVNPQGGFPEPLASLKSSNLYSMRALTLTRASGGNTEEEYEEEEGLNFNLFEGKEKTTWDGIFGVTQVLNRYTLLNINYGISLVSGYQTDPYKFVPIIDSNGYPIDYVNEKRPESRFKQTLKLDGVTAIGKDSLHLSYRYFWDDWGVRSNTFDFKYHLHLGSHFYVVPHYRYSHQSQADFYVLSLSSTQQLPSYASSDTRLAEMTTITQGAMLGWKMTMDTTFTLNIEQMKQFGNSHPADAVGDQKNYDMFPTVTATMVTLGVRTRF